jgi:hypothetical protein
VLAKAVLLIHHTDQLHPQLPRSLKYIAPAHQMVSLIPRRMTNKSSRIFHILLCSLALSLFFFVYSSYSMRRSHMLITGLLCVSLLQMHTTETASPDATPTLSTQKRQRWVGFKFSYQHVRLTNCMLRQFPHSLKYVVAAHQMVHSSGAA